MLLQDSLFDGDKLEFWIIYTGRKNAQQGQYFSFYGRAIVSEDSNDNDVDDLSTREISFGVDGTPKRGWTTLPQSAQEAIEYVYRGLEAMGENKLLVQLGKKLTLGSIRRVKNDFEN